jgi:glycosyltransferase involved in cell wall biosynthesis
MTTPTDHGETSRAATSRPRHGPLRIAVHDYGGYPFIVQLSRTLADRGHHVLHLYADGFRRPKGLVEIHPDDPPTLATEAVRLAEPFRRGGFRRITQERRYGRRLAGLIASFNPDVVISANAPLDVQSAAAAAAHDIDAAFVFWVQDLHSVAITRIVGRRIRVLGTLVGTRFRRLEQRLLWDADAIIAISPTFLPILRDWRVRMDTVEVIENWAPLDDGPPPGRANSWAAEHDLLERPIAMYAGTLAAKHDPNLLLELARGLPDATVVVVAEGVGADWLRAHAQSPDNLRLLPLQPYSRLPEMLDSADLLVAVLEPDASSFSAPSKVLTYLAAGKAILAAVARDNPAAEVIRRAGAGIVVDPRDTAGLVAAARRLLGDPVRLRAAGAAGRAFARVAFDIGRISERFEAIAYEAAGRRSPSGTAHSTETGQTGRSRT